MPRKPTTVSTKRPYSLIVGHNRRKVLAVMWQAGGTEEGYGSEAVGLKGSFTELRSVQIQLS